MKNRIRISLSLMVLALAAVLAVGCSEDPIENAVPTAPSPGDATPAGPMYADKTDGYCGYTYNPELFGISNVGILLVEFTSTETNDESLSFQAHPEYATEIEATMFDTDPAAASVHNLYQEMSDGNVGFTGEVVGSYIIDDSYNSGCTSSARFGRNRAAYDVAVAQGADFEDYDVLMYIFSTDNPCSPIWILVSEAFFASWYSEIDIPEVHLSNWSWSDTDYAHELGHLLGFGHSGDGNTTYGDFSCIMGENTCYAAPPTPAPLRHLNVCWKIAADYIDDATEIYVVDGQADETVQVAPSEYSPSEVPTGAYRVVRVMSSQMGPLYVTYRQPRAPFDIDPTGDRPWNLWANRVMVHKDYGWNTLWLATLEAGDTYEGPDFRIHALEDGLVTEVDEVAVRVELGDVGNCDLGGELACAEPLRYANVAPTRPQSFQIFDVDLTNLDLPMCDPTTFTVNQAATSGGTYFNVVSPSSNIEIDGGETATLAAGMEFQAVPPDGVYGIRLVASAHGDSWTQDVTWILDTVAPAVPANPAAAVTAANTITFSWDGVVDVPAGVDHYEVERNGTVVGTTEDTDFVDGGRSLDVTYSYRVRAYDNAGNMGNWTTAVDLEIPSIVITNIQVVHDGLNCTKTVTWTTNVPSSSVVYFGSSCSSLGDVAYGSGNTLDHTVVCDVFDLSAFAFQVSSSASYVTETSACTTKKRGKCISM